MNNNATDLDKVIIQTMQFLGYSDKLIKKSLADLEKIIAIRLYNRVVKLIPIDNTQTTEPKDLNAINELIKNNLGQVELKRIFLETTKETINEYFEEITKK